MKIIDQVTVHKAEYSDLKDILDLQKTAFRSEAELYDNYTIEPLMQTIDSIREDHKDHIFLKAIYQNSIIGSVKIKGNGPAAWIGKLIVHPDYQNNGIGRKLMTAAEQLFPDLKEYILFTGNKSIKNITLYQSLGYTVTKEFSDDKNPAVLLIKMVKTKDA